MAELVRLSQHGDVAVITIDNPPVNALSPGVPEGIDSALKQALADPESRAIVIIGAGSTFIAGADIREFGKIVAGERPKLTLLPYLLNLEDSPKPVVMAIHGQALGGGLEVASGRPLSGARSGKAQVGQPGSKARHHSGRRRNPTLAASCRCCEGFGDV